jgi:hypothetical protein
VELKAQIRIEVRGGKSGGFMAKLCLILGGLLCLAAGCKQKVEIGKPFDFPKESDVILFGVASVTNSTMKNRDEKAVPGLLLLEASLLQSAAEVANSKHRRFVVFQDFFLGNSVRGRYWQQQSEKRPGLGLPVMDTQATAVLLVETDLDRNVTKSESIRAAHIQISVDSNDFSRPFAP